MNDRLSALRLFVRAERIDNFSRAGRELGMSQPSASRPIAALEEEVGATLFSRSTRAVTLTEAGATHLMRVGGARRRRPRGARNGRVARLASRHADKFRAQGNHPAASRVYEAAPGTED
jgi:DNA-binding transcriptional LysR family regulator